MSKYTCYKNARVVTHHDGTSQVGDIWVRDDVVSEPPAPHDAEIVTVDLLGKIVTPGLFDMQFNGAFDIDFTSKELTVTSVYSVLRQLLQFGITEILATIITTDRETYNHVITTLITVIQRQRAGEMTDCATVLGIHFEGPFLNPSKKGAHNATHLKTPSLTADATEEAFTALWEHVYGQCIKDDTIPVLITIAPELEGALEFIRACKRKGYHIAIGHTTADLALCRAAIQAGASMVTHLYNAMPAFSHRSPGVIGLLGDVAVDGVYFGLIADGVHVDAAALSMAYRCKPHHCFLVTDGMRALGMGPGERTYGDLAVTICAPNSQYPNMHVVLKGTDVLAGAVAPLDACVRHLRTSCGILAEEALRAAVATPRSAIGLPVRGLTPGEPATFVVLDDSLHVSRVVCQGKDVVLGDLR